MGCIINVFSGIASLYNSNADTRGIHINGELQYIQAL
mgnify:CR=1 FL=1